MPHDLIYPFEQVPEFGAFTEVAPGVRWLRFPLPFALNHINLYLLEDGDGWTLVDTGISSDASREIWQRHFEATFEGKPLRRIIVTHFHPDHVGCAGWLVDRWKAEFLIPREEWLFATMLRSETRADAASFWRDFYRSAGLDEETLRGVALRGENYATRVDEVPRPYLRLQDGDTIAIGGRTWRAVVGTGHAPEMACLYAEADRIFISADQVLPGISPNVGVTAPEPFADPLKEFLESTRALFVLDPETLVLPMHGRPFYRLHDRLEALIEHHAERLSLTLDACSEPRTVAELLPILFRRKLDFQQTQFAVGEALAHTNHLVERGELERLARPGQPLRFRTV